MKRECAFALMWATWRELVRGKIIYCFFFFAAALIAGAALFGGATIGDEVKVTKDFGLFAMSLFGVGFVVISGASLLHKELQRKTIYNSISKAVSRTDFIIGKFFGIALTLTCLVLGMGLLLLGFEYLAYGKADPLTFLGCGAIIAELLMVAALTIFFSSIVVTPLLAGLFGFCAFLAGRCSDSILTFIREEDYPLVVKWILRACYELLPHLEPFAISNNLVYGIVPSWAHLGAGVLYALCYSALVLVMAGLIFQRRDL